MQRPFYFFWIPAFSGMTRGGVIPNLGQSKWEEATPHVIPDFSSSVNEKKNDPGSVFSRSSWAKLLPKTLITCIIPLSTLAANIAVQLDRPTVSEGESVNLIITAEGQNDEQPDFSVLDKNFAVLSSGTSSRLQIINGKTTAQTIWQVSLIPKSIGEFTVPKIKVGNEYTKTLKLVVKKQSQDARETPDMFVEVETSPEKIYVQQQLLYKLRLHSARSFMNVQFMPPQADDVNIEQLGHDVRYMSMRGDKNYQVVEKKFLVFPRKSGTLTLSAPVFLGQVADDTVEGIGIGSYMRGFSGFGHAVRVKGAEKSIDILPKPAGFKGQWWLPAEDLTVEESWSNTSAQWKVNEPITRTITIKAAGLMAEQLPNLTIPEIENLNLYPDQPTTKNDVVNGKLIGQKEFKLAMMPIKNGTISVPGVEILWWNSLSGKSQLAKTPSRQFTIYGATAVPTLTTLPPTKNEVQEVVAPVKENKVIYSGDKNYYFYWIIMGSLMLSGWVLCFVFWWATRKKSSTYSLNGTDPKAARINILKWAKTYWNENPPVTLLEVARRLKDPQFDAQIELLERSQYSTNKESEWDAAAFWRAFEQAVKRHQSNKKSASDPLPDLF